MEVTDITAILQTIFAAITVGLVCYGLTTWRHQHIGKERRELAINAITDLYRFRDELKYMRAPQFFNLTPGTPVSSPTHKTLATHIGDIYLRITILSSRIETSASTASLVCEGPHPDVSDLQRLQTQTRIAHESFLNSMNPSSAANDLQYYKDDIEKSNLGFYLKLKLSEDEDEFEKELKEKTNTLIEFYKDQIEL